METTMNMSTEKIKDELTADLKKVFGDVIPANQKQTVGKYIDAYIKNKRAAYYDTAIPIQAILESLLSGGADSKAEVIFHDKLTENKIPFKFQYKIGPFRVDFLITEWLVFELDGPQHHKTLDYDRGRQKYIERMGYEVMRVPLDILVMSPELVIEEIKDRLKACEQEVAAIIKSGA